MRALTSHTSVLSARPRRPATHQRRHVSRQRSPCLQLRQVQGSVPLCTVTPHAAQASAGLCALRIAAWHHVEPNKARTVRYRIWPPVVDLPASTWPMNTMLRCSLRRTPGSQPCPLAPAMLAGWCMHAHSAHARPKYAPVVRLLELLMDALQLPLARLLVLVPVIIICMSPAGLLLLRRVMAMAVCLRRRRGGTHGRG